MSRKSDAFVCVLLVCSMLFQLSVGNVLLAQTNSGSNNEIQAVESADETTQAATAEVNEVDTGAWTLKTGNWLKDGIMSIAKAFISRIRKAEEEVGKAKTQFEQDRTELNKQAEDSTKATADTKKAVATSDSAKAQKDLSQASDKKSKSQKSLLAVGGRINSMAETVNTIGLGLAAVSSALTGLSALPYVGAVCAAIATVIRSIAAVLIKVAAVMKVAAEAVIAAADTGKQSDEDFDKFSQKASEAWKNSGNDLAPTQTAGAQQQATGGDKPGVEVETQSASNGTANQAGRNEPRTTSEPDIPTSVSTSSSAAPAPKGLQGDFKKVIQDIDPASKNALQRLCDSFNAMGYTAKPYGEPKLRGTPVDKIYVNGQLYDVLVFFSGKKAWNPIMVPMNR